MNTLTGLALGELHAAAGALVGQIGLGDLHVAGDFVVVAQVFVDVGRHDLGRRNGLDHSGRTSGAVAAGEHAGNVGEAAGVVGCRIIDSPRERLIAILTNVFVPCNGRFPMMISLIGLFLAASWPMAALMLAGVIVLGVLVTFASSRLLSATLLKGVPSAFTLELPPFRRPQVGRVIARSVVDRTLRLLGRAVAVAAPAGLAIWALANIRLSGGTLLSLCVGALDPFARFLGLDGAILMAFILAFPANELVLPLVVRS